jgi:hypothetical protein
MSETIYDANNSILISLIRKLSPQTLAEDLCSVQPINLPEGWYDKVTDEDYQVDVTWMMIHGYKKVVEPFGHHGLLKTVRWVKNELA